jgi:hypothetical protein
MPDLHNARALTGSLSVSRRRSRWRQPWRYYGLLVLLGLIVGAAPMQPPAPTRPAPPPPTAAPAPVPAAQPVASPMDQPVRLILDARQVYQGLRDYSCVFIKQEQIQGRLQQENVIAMKVRTQPFSVYLRWHAPRSLQGQEVCYVAGRNNGQMRVRSSGLLGAVGFVTLSPTDPRALENSRHTITEAGLGNLIDRYSRGWENERRLNRTYVRIADYEYNKRKCTRVETLHPDNGGGQILFYRSVLYFDKEMRLPIRVENYDWPRQGGDPNGDLVENYSYVDLRLNVGVGEEVFDH